MVEAAAGFDNQIEYLVIARTGVARAAPWTDFEIQAVSTAINISGDAVTVATITFDVNLVASQPLLAGACCSVLTATICPSLLVPAGAVCRAF